MAPRVPDISRFVVNIFREAKHATSLTPQSSLRSKEPVHTSGIWTVDKMARSEETSTERGDLLAGFESVYQSNTICVARGAFRQLEIVARFDFESSGLIQQLASFINREERAALSSSSTTLNHAIL
jgi:hypothetical protein